MNKKSGNTVQAFWVGLGTIGQILLSLVSAMVLSRYFDKVEYGTYKQVLFIYSSFLVIFNAGLPKVYAYYLPKYSRSEGKNIVTKINTLLFLLGVFFSIILYFGASIFADVLKNEALKEGVRIFSVVPMLILPTLGIKGIFASYRQTQYLAIYMAVTKLLMLICIITPVIFWETSLRAALYGWVSAASLSLFFAMFLQTIPFRGVKTEKTDLDIQTILLYSLPIVWASIAGMAIKAADQFYISRYFGSEVFAEFSNGFMNLPFVGFITGAASVVLMPIFSKLNSEPDKKEEIIDKWKSTLFKSALLIFPITFFFIFFAEPIVLLLFGEKYFNSIFYFQIASGLNFFRIIIFAPLILALGESSYYAKVHILIGVSAWIGGYIIIEFIRYPEAIAVFSILNSIILVTLLLSKSAKILEVSLVYLLPIKGMFLVLIHSLLIVMIVYGFFNYLCFIHNKIMFLASSFLLYFLILLITAIPLKIDYLLAIKPLLKRIPFLNKSIT